MGQTGEKAASALKKETTPEELKAVKDVIESFLIAIKNYGLYPEEHIAARKFLANIQQRLDVFLKKFGELRLVIKKDSFLYMGETVYEEKSAKDNLPLFLYRDGIQWIEFQEDLSYGEVVTFLKLINQYKTPTADPEGDLVTALWEAELPHIKYEASDILAGADQSMFSFTFMGADAAAQIPQGEVFARGGIPSPGILNDPRHPGGEATGVPSGHAGEPRGQIGGAGTGYPAGGEVGADHRDAGGGERAGEGGDVESGRGQAVLPANIISIADPDVDKNLLRLTAEEQATLEQMVQEAGEKDSRIDVLELLIIILKEESNQQNFAIILRYLEEEFQEVLQYGDFGFASELLKSVNKSTLNWSGEADWAREKLDEFLHNISSPEILGILFNIREIIENLGVDQLKLLGRVLISLKPKAIETLWAFMKKTTSERISRFIESAIAFHAKRDISCLENLLETREEAVFLMAARVLGKIEGQRSTAILLDKIILHPSDEVRLQAIDIIIERTIREVRQLYPLLNDKNVKIRMKLLNFLGRERNIEAEDMLRQFITQDLQAEKDAGIITWFYWALGQCGSNLSIPYLKEKLFAKSWKMMLGMDSQAHRDGAACALAAINDRECQMILVEAAVSNVSQIRSACQKAMKK